jgi:predicted TIM-barrel fold metal-dependent hydrolase
VSDRIDSCLYHDFRDQTEMTGYLPAAWQEYVGVAGSLPWGLGARDVRVESPYRSPLARPPAPDYDGLRRRLVESGADAGVLAHRDGLLFAADNNAPFGLELCRASNRWTVERWLEPAGSPFFGGIVIQNQYPDEAASEIRRYADHPRVCAVHMGGNGLGKPFGHPIYHPIYEAAADTGLPVVIHSVSETPGESLPHSTSGGLASFTAQYRALAGQSLMLHTANLVAQGVFERYSDLRVLLVGGGIAWLPAFLWRFEVNYGAYGRDVPWLKRSPTEHFMEHFRVGTYRLDRPRPGDSLDRLIRTVPGVEEILCFASGSPEPDADTLEDAEALLPADWHDAILGANALSLFGGRVAVGQSPA